MKTRFQFDTSFVYILCKLPREIRNIYANDAVKKSGIQQFWIHWIRVSEFNSLTISSGSDFKNDKLILLRLYKRMTYQIENVFYSKNIWYNIILLIYATEITFGMCVNPVIVHIPIW